MINDPRLEERLIAQRRQTGADRYDEVWEGVYMMAPMPNNEHQQLVGELTAVLQVVIGWANLGSVFPGANVSDRKGDWEHNFRCPDVAVFLNETAAENCGGFWLGGPDFAVEVVSPEDRTREKLGFYAKVGTRELLVVDRDPWALELYRLQGGELAPAGKSTVEEATPLASEVLPLRWTLLAGETRPQIEIVHRDDGREWTV